MEKRGKLSIILAVTLLVAALSIFAIKQANITNLVIAEFNEENQFSQNSGFLIKSISYSLQGNQLKTSYQLREESGFSQILEAKGILRNLNGEKIAESLQDITLPAKQTKEYELIFNLSSETNEQLRLSLTISGEKGSEWAVKDIKEGKSPITGLTVLDVKEGKIAGILIICIIILIYLIIIYLKKHHTRTRNIFPSHRKKVLIPLDLKENKKKRK